jgi:hypothetical protein
MACSDNDISGTISDTETTKFAVVYNSDHSLAAGTVVRFFGVNDTISRYETITDANGMYTFTKVPNGVYNIMSSKGTEVAFQNSITITSNSSTVKDDTLETPVSISGFVKLQPNHDPRTVTAKIMGSDLYANVSSDGMFSLKPVTQGKYLLRLVSTLAGYSPLFSDITIESSKSDTLVDTLVLPYTGIPVVTGLKINFDTLSGIVHLSWNSANYKNLADYVIYRDFYDSTEFSTKPVAARTDTFFADTIYKKELVSGVSSLTDTNSYHFKYRVAIRNNETVIGQTYKYTDIATVSPSKIEPIFTFKKYHPGKKFFSDSASINDSILCFVQVFNPVRKLMTIQWFDNNAQLVKTTSFKESVDKINDSLYVYTGASDKQIVTCKVTDGAGKIWSSLTEIPVVADLPFVKLQANDSLYAFGDTIKLNIETRDTYGSIHQLELKTGTGSYVTAPLQSETFIIAPNQVDPELSISARVTDDDGKSVTVEKKVFVYMFHRLPSGAPSTNSQASAVFNNRIWMIGGIVNNGTTAPTGDIRYSTDGTNWVKSASLNTFSSYNDILDHKTIVFNDKIWIIGGIVNYALKRVNDFWYSSDGIEWTPAPVDSHFLSNAYNMRNSIVFNDRIWILGGKKQNSKDTSANAVLYSTDGKTLNTAADSAPFLPRKQFAIAEFQNKMWVIGGIDSRKGLLNDVWSSADGISWIQVNPAAEFSPRYGHKCFTYGDKIFLIGGNLEETGSPILSGGDVWYSGDGVKWNKMSSSGNYPNNSCPVIYQGKIWLLGGYSTTSSSTLEVWCSNNLRNF